MKRIYFEDLEEFARLITEYYNNISDEDKDFAIIAKYEEARKIVKELILEDWDLKFIELRDVDYNGYDDEYIISLSSIDEEYEIWCEPMKRNGKYFHDESMRIYILDNCSSKVIDFCESEMIFEVTVGDIEDSCEPMCGSECCGCCDCDEDDNYPHEVDCEDNELDNMHGFNVNKSDENGYYSYSFYSTDKNLVKQMAKMFGK